MCEILKMADKSDPMHHLVLYPLGKTEKHSSDVMLLSTTQP